MQKKALGRGLDALINGGIVAPVAVQSPAVTAPARSTAAPATIIPPVPAPALGTVPANSVQHLPIDSIQRNRYQPRTDFDPDHLKELADSIRQRGVMQPLLVRPLPNARYELIAGERRWRAAREVGLKNVPALVRTANDEEALEIALIENLQREDLNPVEESRAYEQLATQFKLTQEQIADKVGRSRAAVANSLRLLALPEDVLGWVRHGQLSVGHAKVILGLELAEEQKLVAERVIREGLTVRLTEELVEQLKTGKRRMGRVAGTPVKPPQVATLEQQLSQKFGTRVTVRHGRKKGRIEIEYFGNDELSRLLGIFGVENL